MTVDLELLDAALKETVYNRSYDMNIAIAEAARLYLEQSTPPGFVLVPTSPTPEMLIAGDTYARQHNPAAGIWWLRRVFEAMIAARPKPESK